ncbi:Uncharacterised protein [Mycobacteroides abscessus]|nr:Uncharacterised protein [Mycobacteroides abscessus]
MKAIVGSSAAITGTIHVPSDSPYSPTRSGSTPGRARRRATECA